MKKALLFLLLFGLKSYSQILKESDKAIITSAVKEALQEESNRQTESKAEAAKKAKATAVMMRLDTIVDLDVYYKITDRYIHAVEVKNGVYYFNFKGDVPVGGLKDNSTIVNSEIITNGTVQTSRIIKEGKGRIMVFAELAYPNSPEIIKEQELGIGLMSVPFKVRGRIDDIPSESSASIKNVSLTFGYFRTRDKYYYTGKKTRFRWGVVGLAGPSVETLKAGNTNGQILDSAPTSQVYLSLSSGIMLTVYDKINLAFLPIGADIGFSDTSKKWIYNNKYWFGFGLGIDTSLFYFSSKRLADK
ncbi:hypothetical protein OIU80_20160 [Flavobacterium sp. LS1R47]|uniref:Uncharacterized protein n=1 Tax=Flavobacterium frigoritolerans TaxID=2987686 RepID=A0A9X3CAI3_9FLAO|nr:hypothetical protein [Flavobacterium frigoritolerans]MCV9934603.1 hypothetical protein [Flavobacterium frigoritolerans]